MLGAHLATVHNLHYYLALMARARTAITAGRYRAFQAEFAQERASGLE